MRAAKNVAIYGTKALVADHMSGVDYLDISNPAQPKKLGSFFLDGYARDVSALELKRSELLYSIQSELVLLLW